MYATGLALVTGLLIPAVAPAPDMLHICAGAQWRFEGVLGERLDANARNWLLRAPSANPGMLEMFRRRDRDPYVEQVPWAGEFAGKYLLSAVGALPLAEDPELRALVEDFVNDLIDTQAEDGYLGPFRKEGRLLGAWDLWGHYHVMLGLMAWHDATGDERAMRAVVRAADLVCDVYVDGGRRPIEAGSPETNLAVMHVMAILHRRTGEPRYLALIERIEEDMAASGDWFMAGLAGTPYYRLPGHGWRWETLHTVQGLLERHRATGDRRYLTAILNLWESIRHFDRHPSGAFSTNERASGSPYGLGAVETCCSVAWQALTIDVLRATGDPAAADELELTTWNQVLAAQHPTGSWWTYDTPLNGTRRPSFHDINFQWRPGYPELNCCSVNAPRSLAMLSEWAVMTGRDGLYVNLYAPFTVDMAFPGGDRGRLVLETGYPVDGRVRIKVIPDGEWDGTVRLRIPAWTAEATVAVNGEAPRPATPGTYHAVARRWGRDDVIDLGLDMTQRHWTGQGARQGRAALYAGPLLLAFDPHFNNIDTPSLPEIDVSRPLTALTAGAGSPLTGRFAPMGRWRAGTAGGGTVVLCDFATAGAHGTEYVSWLPARNAAPPPVWLLEPAAGAAVGPGPVLLRWIFDGQPGITCEAVVSRDPAFTDIVARTAATAGHALVEEGLKEGGEYYWKVTVSNDRGRRENEGGPSSFRVDPALPRRDFGLTDKGFAVASPLDGDGEPSSGHLAAAEGLSPAADRFGVESGALYFDGATNMLTCDVPWFPREAYSFAAWVRPDDIAKGGLQQVFSAWNAPSDDPLRVVLDEGLLFARIEAMTVYSTPGVSLGQGAWAHVAAVKDRDRLTLYVDGVPRGSCDTPHQLSMTGAASIGIGHNPNLERANRERFTGAMDDFRFVSWALTADEIADLAGRGR